MSIWTHVVGCIRVDGGPIFGARKETIEAILGPMCTFHHWNDRSNLPRGSEGGIEYRIIEYGTGLPWLAIAIWGDLRDYDNVAAIDRWWRELLPRLKLVRDAVLRVEVEGKEPVILSNCGSEAFRM